MCTPLLSCPDPRCSVAWDRLGDLIRAALRRGGRLPSDQIPDLTQEALVALLESKQPGELPENLRGLAVTIARRVKAAWHRRPANRNRRWWRDEFVDRLAASADTRFSDDLVEALNLMADDTRGVFVAVFVDGLGRREAAGTLGLPVREVTMLYHEALDFLARLWGHGCDGRKLRKASRPGGPAQVYPPNPAASRPEQAQLADGSAPASRRLV